MIQADSAEVGWDLEKKRWQVRIRVGEEVIKRPAPGTSKDADEASLRSMAVRIAHDDGYNLDADRVRVVQ